MKRGGQRTWDSNAKAMIIAGGGADNITFDNCISKAQSKYGSYISPANLLGCDNAMNVEFRDCEATGANNTPGSTTGFWQEGNNQASAELHNCTFTKTDGAIGQAESPANPQGSGNLDLKAYNCYIDDSSARTSQPWAAWSQGLVNVFELYSCTFNNNGNTNRVNTNIFHGGGIHFGGGGSSLIKDCTFQNTDSGYNVTWFGTDNKCVQECMNQGNTRQHCENVVCAQPSTEYTLENNIFDANLRTHDRGVVNGIVYENWNTLINGAQYMEGNGTDWEWVHQTDGSLKSATTTAINSPTSNTSIDVYCGHTTQIDFLTGMPLQGILRRMKIAINNDLNAQITVETNSANNTITFIQKEGASASTVSFGIDWNDWLDGQPFSDLSLQMK